jgi:SAM-dependent methyltransferase
MSRGYEPETYWSDRLGKDFDLRGTGHLGHSTAYNKWVYRQKAAALDRALSDLKPGARALDIGSGTGWVVERLRRRSLVVDGCDITAVSVDTLSRRFPDASFFLLALGADRIPREDACYDAVTLYDVAYHIVDDDTWRAGLAEIARVLRPGGRLIVSDRLGDDTVTAADHVRFRSRPQWAEASSTVGLSLERAEPLHRWLSRRADIRGWERLPGGLRGPVEFALETAIPRKPHMRWATLVKR